MDVFAIEKLFFLFFRAAGRFTIVLLALPVFLSCGGSLTYPVGLSVTMSPDGKSVLNRLAVLPFWEISPEDATLKMVSCPLCAAVFRAEKSPQESVTTVEDIFFERLHGYSELTLIAPENAGEVYRRIATSLSRVPLPEILKQTGVELGADGVIVGYVYRFIEREGYPYSVKKPASVAFDVHLVRVNDGLVVWRASFDKTQSSLMENLFQFPSFYKQGGRWVTARELADEGVTEMLKTFPVLSSKGHRSSSKD